jgi:hypothetical protein
MITELEDGLKFLYVLWLYLPYVYGVSLIFMLKCGLVYTYTFISNQVLIKIDQLKC